MTSERPSTEPPSVWVFTLLAAGSSLTPLINRALGDPISGKMNAMLFVAALAFPAASLLYLLGEPRAGDKVAVALTFMFGGSTLLWVDWGRVDGRIVVLASVLFLVPTLVTLVTRAHGGSRR
jgi:hypothetical protein